MMHQELKRAFKKSDIDVVILAGGKGSRLYPLTKNIPKPLVEIGGIPIVEHIIRYFIYYGFKKFKILVGHKKQFICTYFNDRPADVEISCIDTGEDADTAERIWQVRDLISDRFLLSYSDVLHNINLNEFLSVHERNSCIGTVGAVPLSTPYGVIYMDQKGKIFDYLEKPTFQDQWVNGGLFAFEKTIFEYWDRDNKDFSKGMLVKLSRQKKLFGYRHFGFWSAMDTVRENEILNKLWENKEAKWFFLGIMKENIPEENNFLTERA